MTDEGLVSKKLAFEHTLQIAIQACQDVASHIVSDDRLGEPKTNQELFDLLARAGWITGDVAAEMRRAVGLRNILVHGYAAVDPRLVRDILEHHTGGVVAFVDQVRKRLPSPGEP